MTEENPPLEVSDFMFRSLQKVRLFDTASSSTANSTKARLAISSKYQIGFALKGEKEIVSFSSKEVHSLTTNKTNINKEAAIKVKSTYIDDVESISCIGVNCDGSLLALLANISAGTFIHLYDVQAFSPDIVGEPIRLCSMRLGMDSSIGLHIEWNPAFPDIIAASASDNTLLVAKVDLSNPSKYNVVGEKKFGARALAISWSPKGKQLVIGDHLGKVIQLKPELEIVRSTMLPAGLNEASVCGLCWISTTDWLVTYQSGKDIFPYVMIIKKDKPPQWNLLGDLNYCSTHSTLPIYHSFNTDVLLPWNISIVASSKSSEVAVIGKKQELWQVWCLEDGERLDLPATNEGKETFPVGIACDLSSTQNIVMNENGGSDSIIKPYPILMVLTTDGILVSHHVISKNPSHPSCQIAAIPIDKSKIRVGPAKAPPSTVAAPTPASVPTPNMFSGFGTKQTTSTPLAMGAAATTASSIFSTATKPAEPTKASPGLLGGLIASTSTAPAPAPAHPPLTATQGLHTPLSAVHSPLSAMSSRLQPTAASVITATPPNVTKRVQFNPTVETSFISPTSPSPSAFSPVAQTTPKKEEVVIDTVLPTKRAEANALLAQLGNEMSSVKDELKKLYTGLQKTAFIVESGVNAVKQIDEDEVIGEMMKMKLELMEENTSVLKKIDLAFLAATDKSATAEDITDMKSLVRRMKAHDDYDRNIRMEKLIKSYDTFKEKYSIAKKSLESTKKIHVRCKQDLQSVDSIDRNTETKMQQTMKHIKRNTDELRSRVSVLEADTKDLNIKIRERIALNKSRVHHDESRLDDGIEEPIVTMKSIGNKQLGTDKNINELRQKTIELLKRTAGNAVAVQMVKVIPFVKSERLDTTTNALSAMNISKLETSLIMSTTPKADVTMSKETSKSDAATQADAPPPQPVVIIKEVPVTVENTVLVPRSPLSTTTTASSTSNTTTTSMFGTPKSGMAPIATSTPTVGSAGFNLFGGNTFASSTTNSPAEKKEEPKASTAVDQNVDVNKGAVSDIVLPNTPPKESEIDVVGEDTVTATITLAKPAETTKAEQATKSDEVKPALVLPSDPSAECAPSTSAQKAEESATVQATEPAKTTSSIFGGGPNTATPAKPSAFSFFTKNESAAQPASSSPFGTFGQAANTAAQAAPVGTASPSTFSFQPKTASVITAPSPSTFSFNQKPASTAASGFAAAAKAAAVTQEDGMMEDEAPPVANTNRGSSFFGGGTGFGGMGLGSSAPSVNANKNVFGGSIGGNTAPAANSWLFNKNAQTQQAANNSVFGSLGQKPSSGFAAAAQNAAQNTNNTSVFGGAPTFGGKPAFGAKPSFGGSTSVFGAALAQQSNQQSSVFGGGSNSTGGGGGFSKFAGNTSFGGASTGSSIFGGATQAQQQQKQTSSIFGGSQTSTTKSSFNTFR